MIASLGKVFSLSNKDQQGPQREQSRMMRHGPGRGGTVEKAKDPRGALNRLAGYLKDYRGTIIFAIIFTIVSTLLNLVAPYLIGVAIDQIGRAHV